MPPQLAQDPALPAGLARALCRRRACASSASTRPASPGGDDEAGIRQAIEQLAIPYPVALDHDFLLWKAYANRGWPSRYLFAPRLKLFETHQGEGDYAGTERAIQELLEIDEPLHPAAGPRRR